MYICTYARVCFYLHRLTPLIPFCVRLRAIVTPFPTLIPDRASIVIEVCRILMHRNYHLSNRNRQADSHRVSVKERQKTHYCEYPSLRYSSTCVHVNISLIGNSVDK